MRTHNSKYVCTSHSGGYFTYCIEWLWCVGNSRQLCAVNFWPFRHVCQDDGFCSLFMPYYWRHKPKVVAWLVGAPSTVLTQLTCLQQATNNEYSACIVLFCRSLGHRLTRQDKNSTNQARFLSYFNHCIVSEGKLRRLEPTYIQFFIKFLDFLVVLCEETTRTARSILPRGRLHLYRRHFKTSPHDESLLFA